MDGDLEGDDVVDTDAWDTVNDSDNVELVYPWLQLLSEPRNLRGLVRIDLKTFLGPRGYTAIKQMQTVTAAGNPIVSPTDVASVDARAFCRSALDLAQTDHRRHAHSRYRLQLWKITKKGEPEVPGEVATIVLGGGEEQLGGNVADGNLGALLGRQMLLGLETFRRATSDLLNTVISLSQTGPDAQLRSAEHFARSMDMRAAAWEQAHRATAHPSPSDWNQRVKDVANAVGPALLVFAQACAPMVAAVASKWATPPGYQPPPSHPSGYSHDPHAGPTGAVPPTPPSAPSQPPSDEVARGDQERARAFFASIDGDQADQLRASFGDELYSTLAAVIHGPLDGWLADRERVRQHLQDHWGDLARVLRPEQLAVLWGAR